MAFSFLLQIMGLTNEKTGEEKFICAAFPSACGKTNLASTCTSSRLRRQQEVENKFVVNKLIFVKLVIFNTQMSDCYLTPIQQFFSYIMTRTT
jgi:GTP-dependent phosphoenolpyruvate carboxykinase